MKKLLSPILFIGLFLSCEKQTNFTNDQYSEFAPEIESDLVSITDIKKAALNFINGQSKIEKTASTQRFGKNTSGNKAVKEIIEKKSSENSTSIFIINYDNGGFCIMSDNTATQPVLAFSDKGYFNPNDPTLNSGIELWLDESLIYVHNQKSRPDSLIANINHAEWIDLLSESSLPLITTQNNNDPQRLAAMNQRMYQIYQMRPSSTVYPLSHAASVLPYDRYLHFKSIAQDYGSPEQYTLIEILDKQQSIEVGRLMDTDWYQNGIFGQEVPNGLAGCTATATGQIMNYYKFPNNFNWNKMTTDSMYYFNDVSLLMKTLGQKFNMVYDIDGSGAHIADVKSGLEFYGYNVTQKDHFFEDVENFVRFTGPVYLTGCRNTTFLGLIYKDCHAWVAEGFRQYDYDKAYRIEWQTGSYTYNTNGVEYFQKGNTHKYYYVNWGWGANYNGWFSNPHFEGQSGYHYEHRRRNLYITKP